MMELTTYFLLLQDSRATRINKSDESSLYVSAGSLWVVNEQPNQHDENHRLDSCTDAILELKSCELINVYLSCSPKDALSINEIEFELLLAVDSFVERKRISTETSFLQIGRDIYDRYLDQFTTGQMCETFVNISNYDGLPDKTCGLIQYVGPLPSCSGVWFGVKLPFIYKGLGATDGSFKGKRFFECDENCGIFLSIDKISIYLPHKVLEGTSFVDDVHTTSGIQSDDALSYEGSTLSPSNVSLVKPPLELGERVVWISDDGPELGTVRWIGLLPDARVKEYTIGVEFDRPIGTGTGKYNNEQLFRTAQNHASLIPVLGLMKAEEFFGSKAAVPEATISGHLSLSGSVCYEGLTMDSLNKSSVPYESSIFENPNSSGPSEVDLSGDSVSQPGTYPGQFNNQAALPSRRLTSGSSDISPSVSSMSGTHNLNLGTNTLKITGSASVGNSEHCYENVVKDETGRILNRDSNVFKVAADNQSNYPANDYLDFCYPMMTPSSFHRSFDDIYAENKKKSKYNRIDHSGNQIYNSMDYDRVERLKISDGIASRPPNDSDIRSRTLETYSTTKSIACKVFDENDILLRLPYTTGRSTFYGRADDDSLHAKSDSFGDEDEQNKITSSSKPHRIFKFISKRAPNVILQQINKTLRTSLLPQSFHRRSSSDSVPTLPEKSSAPTNNLTLFSDFNRGTFSMKEEEASSKDRSPGEDSSQVPSPIHDTQIVSATRRSRPCELKSPHQQPSETCLVRPPTTVFSLDYPKSPHSHDAVILQPKSNESMQMESSEHKARMSEFDIGSQVEVDVDGRPCYGIVRWMSCFKNKSDILVGLELEEELRTCTDEKMKERRFFSCPPRRAYFTFLHSIKKDSRFSNSSHLNVLNKNETDNGTICSPLCFEDVEALSSALTTMHPHDKRWTQQPLTSNFIDVVLYSLFTFSSAFDFILFKSRPDDFDTVLKIKHALVEDVINPLRCGLSLNAEKVGYFEKLVFQTLSNKSDLELISGDAAQFFTHLMQTLRVDPLIVFDSGAGSYVWNVPMQLESFVNPSVQHLFELSFFHSNLKLSHIPHCLLLQIQRGSNVKEFVIPSLVLDITDVLQTGLRECNICGKFATSECKECFEPSHLISSTVFCSACSNQFHSHAKRTHHKPLPIDAVLHSSHLPADITSGSVDIFREKLELFAVICSYEFHCVSFVRTGISPSAPWVFYNNSNSSPADQGPPLPQMGICSFLPGLMCQSLNDIVSISRTEMSILMERFLFNADIFIYQFPTLLLYR